MLRDALAVLPRSDDGIGTAIVGGVLLFLTVVFVPLWLGLLVVTPLAVLLAPIALAPALVLRGYYVRVIQSGLAGDTSVPSFVGWGGLYRAGVASVLLSIVLLLPAVLLVALGAAAGAVIQLGRVDLGGMAEPVYAVSIGFVAVLLIGYLLAFLYVRPAALACFAATGRLAAGLSPRRNLRVAFSGGFATGWLVAMFVTLAGLVLVGPFLAVLVGFPLLFVVRVVAHNLYGRGASETLDCTAASDASGEPVAVDAAEEADPVAAETHGELPSEPTPDVQVGRRVPLTASDVLSRAASREGESISDESSDTAGSRAAGDDSGSFEWADVDEE
ncbi:hypothetical protein AArcCO_1852 [Halalkaliarchaeum sp. AArc-CO]|uniref:DUF4013 domain-containing protein n=1 Tax=unclassified Halalkaliarchaeum TaxID=2678344 RepID=UPI00217ECC00|nr:MULTISPECIES: DUF4013 domain-containing protein [unclassified Halalkaliarchaeum]MDR5671650.1 DUF4013 domain-containing protein [Halalkaliarchaeum sp. AArc-GB]UWG51151.1 hypothetical protein AArcCO_1852 [Halalkaliarchaeum sp. AArc-CO]